MKARTLALSLLATLALFGCSEDVTTPESEAPALPPTSTMNVDLSFFADNNPTARLSGEPSHDNFLSAALIATTVNLTMVAVFTPPALAFQTAIGTAPEQQEDGSWLWTYGWQDTQEHVVSIQLQAWHDALGNAIDWELRVSDNQAEPPYEDFVWFTGQSSTVEDTGYWIFYDRADAGETARGGESRAVVQVDWSVEDESHRSLVITAIDEMDENVGDSLTYALDATIGSMTFYDASADESSDITWDELTGAGSIQSGGVRACWNESQEDVECPEPTS